MRALERLADAEVQLGAADAGDPVVDGAAHELVREAAGGRRPGQLLEQSRLAVASSTAASERAPVEPGGLGEDAQLEPRPGDGRQLEQSRSSPAQPRQALPHDVADPLGAAQLGDRPRQVHAAVRDLDGAALAQVAPELAEQQRRPVGELADRGSELRASPPRRSRRG